MPAHGASFARAVARGTKWCVEHPWPTLGVVGVILVAATLGAWRFAIDPSPEAYLTGSPDWEEYARIDKAFGIGETVVVALYEPGGTIFDAETVRVVAELDRSVAAMRGVRRVLSIASASALGNVGSDRAADVIDVSPLLAPGPVTPESATALGKRISEHKVYPRVLVDERHETAFLLVQLDADRPDPIERLHLVERIREAADAHRARSRSVHLAGPTVTKEAIAWGVRHDRQWFYPATIAVVVVLLWLMFGDLLTALVPIGIVGMSSICVVGLLGLRGSPLNMATVMVPTIILVVGLADSVHLLAELRRQFARYAAGPDDAVNRNRALVATIEAIALPCLLTSATSAVGFLALVFSRVVPLREFGIAAALGLMLAYLGSMFVTPVLLAALRYPKAGAEGFVAAPRMGRALTNLASRLGRNVLVPIASTGLLFGACIAALSLLEINSDFIGYLSPEHRLRRDMEVIGHTLGGADTLEVVLSSTTSGAFREPAMLERADRAATEVRRVANVHGVLGFVDYLKLANSLIDPERGFAVPQSREGVAQLLLLEAEGFPALASMDTSEIRMSLQVPSMSSADVRRLAETIRDAAARGLGGEDVRVTVSGIPLLFSDVVRYLIEDAKRSFGVVVLLIWIAMVLGFRSLSLATVAMVPNLIPIGLTFATMAVFDITFDLNSAFVACLGIGIAVDDTIHIVARYQRAREQGSPTTTRALRYALTHAGHPVLLTSALLAAGFLVLCLSAFAPTVRVGMMAALLVTYAAIFDLCFLPALLIATDRVSAHFEPKVTSKPSPITGSFEEAASTLTQPPGPADED